MSEGKHGEFALLDEQMGGSPAGRDRLTHDLAEMVEAQHRDFTGWLFGPGNFDRMAQDTQC